MDYSPEEYTRFYIVQALFKLMSEYAFDRISVTDIAEKAGVGRATFYRYFKRKEDVIVYYFEHNTKEFVFSQRFYPRCKEDYVKTVVKALTVFRENKEVFKLIKKARLEYVYLDYLNANFVKTFESDYPDSGLYSPYIYAGMLFNVSMRWMADGFITDEDELARMMVNAIYGKDKTE